MKFLELMMQSKRMRFFFFLWFVWGLTISTRAQDAEVLRQRVLHASHLTRINDSDMKPWHLKIGFQLFDSKGKPSEQGTVEYWWGGPMLLKARIESPSYSATVIRNRDGSFRTTGSGPVPREIAAIEQDLIYPMPMTEDLSGLIPHLRQETLENSVLDCIQLGYPTMVSKFPTFCLDPTTDVLRSIHGAESRSIIFDNVRAFQGRSVAFSLGVKTGELNTATAEVIDLSEISVTQDLFTPSQDMDRVRDANIATRVR